MRRRPLVFLPLYLALGLIGLCAVPPAPVFAAEVWVATVTSSGASANVQVPNGMPLSVQCDVAVRYRLDCGSSTAAVDTDWKIDASPGYDIDPLPAPCANNATYLAMKPLTGSYTCQVFKRPK